MPVKVPIPIINQRVINNVLPRKTILSHQPCHPMQQPAKIPKSKRDQKATPDGAADHIRPPIHAFPFESMGRSGYDTTNMKVAKDPRPANKPKSTGDHEKNKIPEQQQEQQRKDQG
ncbi:hypothetical protein N0V82_002734 [Gnomoniopsis sp. IMI 355080]|nr:hypothetical protein N0V82_002734 [Gnomoniopsis sp. IMI 355080]